MFAHGLPRGEDRLRATGSFQRGAARQFGGEQVSGPIVLGLQRVGCRRQGGEGGEKREGQGSERRRKRGWLMVWRR